MPDNVNEGDMRILDDLVDDGGFGPLTDEEHAKLQDLERIAKEDKRDIWKKFLDGIPVD